MRYDGAQEDIQRSLDICNALAGMSERQVISVTKSDVPYDVVDAATHAILLKLAQDGISFKREALTAGSAVYHLRHVRSGDIGDISIRKISDSTDGKRSEIQVIDPGTPDMGIAKVVLLEAAVGADHDFEFETATNPVIAKWIESSKANTQSSVGDRDGSPLWSHALRETREAIKIERTRQLTELVIPKYQAGLANSDIGWAETTQNRSHPKHAKAGRKSNEQYERAWTLISSQGMDIAQAFEWWYANEGRLSREVERKRFYEAMRRLRQKSKKPT
jgi:hypothetical protein